MRRNKRGRQMIASSGLLSEQRTLTTDTAFPYCRLLLLRGIRKSCEPTKKVGSDGVETQFPFLVRVHDSNHQPFAKAATSTVSAFFVQMDYVRFARHSAAIRRSERHSVCWRRREPTPIEN